MKKLLWLSTLGVLLFSTPVFAQSITRVCLETNGHCVDVGITNPFTERSGGYGIAPLAAPQYCQITNLTAATNLVTASCATGTILAKATIAQICVSTQGVRYTSSGVVTPTASVGIPVPASACFQYSGPISTVQFIQQVSGAILDIETFP